MLGVKVGQSDVFDLATLLQGDQVVHALEVILILVRKPVRSGLM